jgi:hypothetical protein
MFLLAKKHFSPDTGGLPVILPTWRAEIRRIKVQGQPWQIVCEIPSPK